MCLTEANSFKIFVLLVCYTVNSFPQNVEELLKNPENYSFEDFNSFEDSIEYVDYELYNNIIEIHEKEAFNRKDTFEIIKTHLWNVWELNDEEALAKFNYVLNLSDSRRYQKYRTTILNNLGVYYYNELNDPVVALEYFIQSLKLADQLNYYTLIIDNLNSIASIKSEYSQERQAIFLLNYSLNLISKNKKNIEDYFKDKALRMIINQPLEVAKKSDSVDLKITVLGGGLSGQAGAIKHGLSRALTLIDPNTKDSLKKNGFLTRDSRTVERKKYGRQKARRSFQFSKR